MPKATTPAQYLLILLDLAEQAGMQSADAPYQSRWYARRMQRLLWAMQDRVVWDEARAQEVGIRSLTGYGHYRERYARCDDGQWRIARTELTRLHIDFETVEG